MGGKHRKDKSPEVTRRSLLGMLVGGSAAAGVMVATSGKLYHRDDLHSVLAETVEPQTTQLPTTSTTSAPETTTVQPATNSPTSTPTTTTQRASTSLSDELAEQPRTGWGLLPAAAASTHLVATLFGITTVGGYRASSEVAGSDHPKRLAADFMTNNQTTNRALGNFVIANRKLLRVKYAISLQHYNDGSGWVLMEDRGSRTANHFDHCHVSFY
ncbi:MAG: hypothetical protein EKK42_20330 [Pseudonocardiaceae bacterium]|nr:MAG: hypothetical protein EKK42_20330 [Pseudonocardiaceae bacterium]